MDHAQMVELVDTQDLKSCSRKRSAGSIPALSTATSSKSYRSMTYGFFYLWCILIYIHFLSFFSLVSPLVLLV